jgi:nicotinate-nucleotide pyrophosphorylase (carboxylating)
MHTTDDLIQLALKEDIGPGDITTDNLVAPDTRGTGTIVAKQDLVIAGLRVAERVFTTLEPAIDFESLFTDGDRVPAGSTVVRIEGTLGTLLKGERTALNFLQRMSGIATQARDLSGRLPEHRSSWWIRARPPRDGGCWKNMRCEQAAPTTIAWACMTAC